MLDTWEEMQSAHEEETKSLTDALIAEKDRRLREVSDREEALLDLCMDFHDLLFSLRRTAENGSPEWARQFSLVDRKLSESRVPAGFQVLCDTDVPVNYSLHEVVAAEDTSDPDMDQMISDVYTCGYLYQGRVLRKASVAAFRCRAAEPEPENADPYGEDAASEESEESEEFEEFEEFEEYEEFEEEENYRVL